MRPPLLLRLRPKSSRSSWLQAAATACMRSSGHLCRQRWRPSPWSARRRCLPRQQLPPRQCRRMSSRGWWVQTGRRQQPWQRGAPQTGPALVQQPWRRRRRQKSLPALRGRAWLLPIRWAIETVPEGRDALPYTSGWFRPFCWLESACLPTSCAAQTQVCTCCMTPWQAVLPLRACRLQCNPGRPCRGPRLKARQQCRLQRPRVQTQGASQPSQLALRRPRRRMRQQRAAAGASSCDSSKGWQATVFCSAIERPSHVAHVKGAWSLSSTRHLFETSTNTATLLPA